jgi:hypothetical protein
MRLDAINQVLGMKTPAQVFKKCFRCKGSDLLEFEGEVFCQRCSWDSVVIHAEALAVAMANAKRGKRRKSGVQIKAAPVSSGSTPYLHLFLPSESQSEGGQSSSGKHPEVA